jgi:hypothetical protein
MVESGVDQVTDGVTGAARRCGHGFQRSKHDYVLCNHAEPMNIARLDCIRSTLRCPQRGPVQPNTSSDRNQIRQTVSIRPPTRNPILELAVCGLTVRPIRRSSKKGAILFRIGRPQGLDRGEGEIEPVDEMGGLRTAPECQSRPAKYFAYGRNFLTCTMMDGSRTITRSPDHPITRSPDHPITRLVAHAFPPYR